MIRVFTLSPTASLWGQFLGDQGVYVVAHSLTVGSVPWGVYIILKEERELVAVMFSFAYPAPVQKMHQNSVVLVMVFLQGDRGCTPLYYALRQGNLPMVQMLLEFGARIDITMKADAEVGAWAGGFMWI